MATNPSRSAGGSTATGYPAGDASSEAKATASELKDKAQNEAEKRLSEGKSKATGALEDVAGVLHDAGSTLRDRDHDAFARYADAAADQVERFTRSIRDRNVGELLDEAEQFARRDAGLFIGGAFLLGIVGARFLKASAPSSGRTSYRRTSYGGAYSGGARPGGYTGYDQNQPPYRVRNTPGGEMPNPDAGRTQTSPDAGRTQTSASVTSPSAT